MKNNKGITLIALVVTIIVLLILAGISIAMLTGDNGILTNASKASTTNAYYGAEEQVKLAYMAVRTEIMAQVVKDGTYDARINEASGTDKVENTKALAQIVKNDLKDDNKWDVYYVGSEKDATSKTGVIYITYKDTAIDAGVIENGKPANEGNVYYTITLDAQGATLLTDRPTDEHGSATEV